MQQLLRELCAFVRNNPLPSIRLSTTSFPAVVLTPSFPLKMIAFWNWFKENERFFTSIKSADDEIANELKKRLELLHENLTFEIGGWSENQKGDFIISAGGMKDAFPAVQKLVKSAPELQYWTVIPFVPPTPEEHLCSGTVHMEYDGVTVEVSIGDDFFFRWEQDGKKIGVELHIRNYEKHNAWDSVTFVVLDHLLGEYDVVTQLGWIELVALEEKNRDRVLPILELKKIVEKNKSASNFDACFVL